jgi:nitroreductase
MSKSATPRIPEANVDPLFLTRWSPRAFADSEVSSAELDSLFEAARWSPSCFNEQPWLFLYARESEDRSLFLDLLMEGNRPWAGRAPVLAFVVARRQFRHNSKPNRWAGFDSGAAWMSLALAAHQCGLVTHAMGGFDQDRAYEVLQVPSEEFEIMAAMAIGHPGDAADLPEALREREEPSSRNPLDSIRQEGVYQE